MVDPKEIFAIPKGVKALISVTYEKLLQINETQ